MRKQISQREAVRLSKRVRDLAKQLADMQKSWVSDWPGGKHLGSMNYNTHDFGVLRGRAELARQLGFAIVVTVRENELRFYAAPIKPI